MRDALAPSPAFAAPSQPIPPGPREQLVSISNEELFDLDRPTPALPLSPARALIRDRAALVRMDGPRAGEPFIVPKGGLSLGRGVDVDVRVDDDGASRLHASIVFEPDEGWVLTDRGSRNGTTVDGVPVSRHVLSGGELVRLGPHTTLRFAITDGDGEDLIRHLYQSSTADLLTGAFNRRHFDERFAAEVAYAARHRTQLALLIFDLDHFKRINDTHGHAAGDAILRHVAALVTARLRVEDVFARYGGEEFVVLLRNIDVGGASRAAERLRGATAGARPIYRGALIPVTISVGCATLSECENPSCASLLELADRRLYLAKGAGRNRVTSSGC